MNYKQLHIYFLYFLAGIFQNTFILSFLIPLTVNLTYLDCSFLFSCILFFFGLFWFKFFAVAAVSYGIAIGNIEYKTDNSIYISQAKNLKNMKNFNGILKLKYDKNLKIKDSWKGDLNNNSELFKTGSLIKFSYVMFGNQNGKMTGVYQLKSQNLTFLQRKREEISLFLSKSKYSYFLKAITIGDKSEFTKEQSEKLKASGFWHLVAISGLHMNILVYLLFRIFRKFFSLSFKFNYRFNTRYLSAFFATLFGFFYLQLSLYSVSSIRALIMLSSNLFFGGRLKSQKIIIYTAFIMLFINPHLAFDLGFQLSFLCTYLLVNKFSIFLVNLSIIPIIKQFNLIAVFTNFLIIPIFSAILFLIFFSIIFKLQIFIIIDFLSKYLFKIMEIPSVLVYYNGNDFTNFLFLSLLNILILKQKPNLLIFIFIIIWLTNFLF